MNEELLKESIRSAIKSVIKEGVDDFDDNSFDPGKQGFNQFHSRLDKIKRIAVSIRHELTLLRKGAANDQEYRTASALLRNITDFLQNFK